MKTHFICPDGVEVLTGDCIKDCRMGMRCMSKAYARRTAEDRPWTGKPSVTQLIRGTRESYLRLTQSFSIKPNDEVFAVMGSRTHGNLENYGSGITEERFEYAGITGMPDNYEDGILEDYKNAGSYKVAKVIGIVGEDVPVLDDYGQPVIYKSGKREGQVKTKKRYYQDWDKADMKDWELQLNMYAIILSRALNVPVNDMFVEIFVRDGGLQMAKQRGVEETRYYLRAEKNNEEEVLDYFTKKRDALLEAIKTDTLPPMCTEEENWEGNKCKGYCPVAFACPNNPHLTEG